MAVEEWRFPGTLGTTSAWQERTVINTYDPWKVGWLFEAPRGVKMAYLLIRLPVKMLCYVRLMDFFLGLDNPDCFGLFSPFPGSEKQWGYFIIGNPDFMFLPRTLFIYFNTYIRRPPNNICIGANPSLSLSKLQVAFSLHVYSS